MRETGMIEHPYIMEHCEEGERLVRKTRKERVVEQACWAGIQPGMRVLDVGCGAGITTSILAELTGPDGRAVGIDGSAERIENARNAYPAAEFQRQDIYSSLSDLGSFDFIWVRFFLEYHRREAQEIVRRLGELLTPQGVLCVADLDYNSMTHHPLEEDMALAIDGLIAHLEAYADWDPYLGRKLFTFFHDLGFRDINLKLEAHHLIPGAMTPTDEHNWLSKLKIAAGNSGYIFPELTGGFDEFFSRTAGLLSDPRRLTYTPLILCRGLRPTVR